MLWSPFDFLCMLNMGEATIRPMQQVTGMVPLLSTSTIRRSSLLHEGDRPSPLLTPEMSFAATLKRVRAVSGRDHILVANQRGSME